MRPESWWCADCDGSTTLDEHAHCLRCGSDALAPTLSPPFRPYDGWIECLAWGWDGVGGPESPSDAFSPEMIAGQPPDRDRGLAPPLSGGLRRTYEASPTDDADSGGDDEPVWSDLPEDEARRGGLPVE